MSDYKLRFFTESFESETCSNELDPLYDEAVLLVNEYKWMTFLGIVFNLIFNVEELIKNKFNIGYGRAEGITKSLELAKVISEVKNNARKIL